MPADRQGALAHALEPGAAAPWSLLGIVCFYVVYVSYRNLKSFLPFVRDTMYDRELHMLDRALLFGHDPAHVLHGLLGEGFMAWPLSYVYLWFLPLVPLAVTAWLVWSRNLSLRLLVRDLAVHRLDARHRVVLRAPDPRPRPRVRLALRRPAEHRRPPS